jgi:hypothetical protein
MAVTFSDFRTPRTKSTHSHIEKWFMVSPRQISASVYGLTFTADWDAIDGIPIKSQNVERKYLTALDI